jgi:hypothetical protein
VRSSASGALLDALDALHVLGERFEFEEWRQVFRPQLCRTSAQRSWERFKAALRRFGVPFGSDGHSSPVLVFAPGVRGVIESLLPSTDDDDDDDDDDVDAACEPRAAAGGGQFDRPLQRADLQRLKAAAKRLRFPRREARRIEGDRARASVDRQLLGRRLLAEQAQRERRGQAPAVAPSASARRAERSRLEKILAAEARRVGAGDAPRRVVHAGAGALERSARACFTSTTARDAVEFAHELARREPSLWIGRATTACAWWSTLTRLQRLGA